MKTRPMLMSAPMVRALLDGTKTQTRRVAPIAGLNINTHSENTVTWGVSFSKPVKGVLASHSGGRLSENQARRIIAAEFCPYGRPGDRLWVREAWRAIFAVDHMPPRYLIPAHRIWYEADAPHQPGEGKLRPSMFMPRWASRITLEIVGVRVERLQDISAADAIAEGIAHVADCGNGPIYHPSDSFVGTPTCNPVDAYGQLWEQINGREGPASWGANPFVWVVEFKRVDE